MTSSVLAESCGQGLMVAILSAFTVLAMTAAASAVPLLKCILVEIVVTLLQVE